MATGIGAFILAGNRLLREALARILNKRNDLFVVGGAALSSQSIQEVADSGAQVLILDLGTNVTAVCQLIRELRNAIPKLRVLMIGMSEDEDVFLQVVRAGAVGFMLKDASAMEVVAAVRSVAQDEGVCPPRLCLSLIRYVSRQSTLVPNVRVKLQLGLSRREQQLLPLIAQGLTNKEIATQLFLSEQTVKNHIHRMLEKIGVSDRLTVVELCRMQGLLI